MGKKVTDKELIAIVHSNLGLAYFKNREYLKAEENQS